MKYPDDFINKIICGDSLSVLRTLPSKSIDMCMTSPPYWGLRDYGVEQIFAGNVNSYKCKHIWGGQIIKKNRGSTGSTAKVSHHKKERQGVKSNLGQFCIVCKAWKGQLGLEPTPELYIEHLTEIFSEVKRVLKKEGTLWLNIGDTYSTHTSKRSGQFGKKIKNGFDDIYSRKRILPLQEKCLCMIPERLAWSLIQDGWILRNKIIWYKPNAMPSSVTDRFSNRWEYVFMFSKSNNPIYWTNRKTLKLVTKQPTGTKGIEGEDWKWQKCKNCEGKGKIIIEERFKKCSRCDGLGKIKINFWQSHDYYFDLDAVREAYSLNTHPYGKDGSFEINTDMPTAPTWGISGSQSLRGKKYHKYRLPSGKNPGDIFEIATQPFSEAHFAVFPEKLCEKPIKAGCPEEVCKKCGKARERIVELGEVVMTGGSDKGKLAQNKDKIMLANIKCKQFKQHEHKTIGWTSCGCEAGFEDGILLDPFCGAGTALLVAKEMKRNYIGIDIKREFKEMSDKRLAQGVL